MFESKTVFVVGAGASDEVGLPIGRKLTLAISSLLNINADLGRLKSGDSQIYETLKRIVQKDPDAWRDNNLIGSARHIGEAMELATSIDTFLESFGHDKERVLLGKLGIAKAILKAEGSSKLAPSKDGFQPFNIKTVADTWYVSLAQLIFSGVSAQNIPSAFDNISFIVFNYDRCIQVFLIRALQVYFQLSQAEAEQIVKSVRIFYPYGCMGSIFSDAHGRVPFGTINVDLATVADRIDTFSESVRDEDTLSGIRSEINEAETLVFLGFGFHQQNMEVLSDPTGSVPHGRREARVLATTLGLSESDTQIVRSTLSSMVWGQPPSGYIDRSIHTFNGTCSRFFGEYWRSLTAPVAGTL
jgi:hypothetical protein